MSANLQQQQPAETSPSRPSNKLFGHWAVLWATLIGSPLAGGIVMAINYVRLGQRRAAFHAIFWTAMFLVAVGVAITALKLPQPPDAIVPLLPVLPVIVMDCVARGLQGEAVAEHIRRGGTLASAWWGVAIGIAVMICITIPVAVLLPGR